MELAPIHLDVLNDLARAAPHPRLIQEIAEALHTDQSPIAAACAELASRKLVRIDERAFEAVAIEADGKALLQSGKPLPERTIAAALVALGGQCRITELPQHCGLTSAEVGQSLRWLNERGWAKKSGDTLVLSDAGRAAAGEARHAERDLLERLAGSAPTAVRRDELAAFEAELKLLAPRKGILSIKPRTDRHALLTDEGRALLAAGVTARRTVTQLTPEMLHDGSWREVSFQPYDVTLSAKSLHPGKEHAFQRTLDRVRRVFLEMGFVEVVSPWVESSFWDFDALFQPQDHPARDMQDTFYVANPPRTRLPDAALVERIRRTHENGGETGSTGWRYRWNPALADRPVLRTHTTAATIRALAAHAAQATKQRGNGGTTSNAASSSPPGKYFVIGPVFRRETVDYKHLPVFHQVDGIIVDPKASLSTLLGTLAAFYAKMGFPKVRFRPSFFPYTEPSAEVFLYLEQRGEWVEMGGSGIFRPEVTQPLGITDRVLAWGLGLERLAMMIHGLKSIGELYFATMPWLREAPLSRA